MMFDANTILIVITFLLAGAVKGVIGLGLPTVSLALLTLAFDLPTAMAFLLAPSLATNLWQAAVGGNAQIILARLWPFLLTASVTVWLGARALTRVDLSLLSALLGALLIIYAVASLAGLKINTPRRFEKWLGPLAGLVNGVLTGMTGSFVVPGVLYLQSLGLTRDSLIQAMGMLFSLSTLALGLALHGNNLLSIEQAGISSAALVPAIAGMVLGQKIRQAISEQLFRKIFFLALLTLGAYIVFNALVGFA